MHLSLNLAMQEWHLKLLMFVWFVWQIEDGVVMVSITIPLNCFLILNDVHCMQLEHEMMTSQCENIVMPEWPLKLLMLCGVCGR